MTNKRTNLNRLARMLVAACIVMTLAVGCGSSQPAPAPTPTPTPGPQPQEPPKGGNLIMGLASDIMERGGMDPAISSAVPNFVVVSNIYQNLFYYDTDLTVKPGLAESWSVSNNGLVYTLKLRKGVKFQDGTPFNAEAVKFMFERRKDPELKASMGGLPYDKAVVVDEHTVEIHLARKHAPFIMAMCAYTWGVPSPTAVQKHGADYQANPVGTGPFAFKNLVPGESITLERWEEFDWIPPNMFTHTGPAYLETITFRFISEEVPRMGALETGECNAVVYVSADGYQRFTREPNKYVVTIDMVPGMPFTYYLNLEIFPMSDPAVRQAMNYATDQKTMISTLYPGVVTAANGTLSPAIIGHDPRIDQMYPYDPEKAKQVLEDAGWKLAADGFRYKDGQKLTVVLGTLTGERFQMCAEWMQVELIQVGIDAQIEVMTSGARLDAGAKGTHMSLQKGAASNDPSVLRVQFHSSEIGTNNFSRFADPQVDAWLDEAAGHTDMQKRVDLYYKVQERAMQEALILPIWYTTHAFAHLTNVKGIRMDGSGYYPFLYDAYVE